MASFDYKMKYNDQTNHNTSLKCKHCPNRFQTQEMLDIHVAAQHLKKERINLGGVTIQRGSQVTKPSKCSRCGKIFDSEHRLAIHSLIHRSGSKATIESIPKLDKKTSENRSKSPQNETQFQCIKCKKVFQTLQHLNSHVNKCDVSKSLQQNATYCSKRNPSDHQFKTCGKDFEDDTSQRNHVAITHEICIKTEKNEEEFATKPDENPFKCDICAKVFPLESILTKHQNVVHSRAEDFKCYTCSQCFLSNEDLSNHIKIAHEGNYDRKHCEFCSKTFKQSWKLQWHVDLYHCPHCEICISLRQDLKDHMEHRHGGEKLETCKICSSMSLDLGNHMRLAHKGFLYAPPL